MANESESLVNTCNKVKSSKLSNHYNKLQSLEFEEVDFEKLPQIIKDERTEKDQQFLTNESNKIDKIQENKIISCWQKESDSVKEYRIIYSYLLIKPNISTIAMDSSKVLLTNELIVQTDSQDKIIFSAVNSVDVSYE